jgi:deazaflavin-dependent oxidoreductase (nitroreductase family)
MAMSRSMKARGNAIGLWLHRTFKGRLDGGGKEGGVLMVTSPGRRTGLARSPDWFRNLREAEEATIEIGTRSWRVRPEVLTGAERDRVWNDVVLARIPSVSKYERKAQRTIPVARLHPM